jgi:vacuolar-type H+-ATPase subunit D/Vma8
MAIELETLNNEREILKKDFDNLTQRIAQVEKDLGTMKSNLNAVYGAIQQVDKLIKLSSGDEKMSPEKKRR